MDEEEDDSEVRVMLRNALFVAGSHVVLRSVSAVE
jgi:hypothetical protein